MLDVYVIATSWSPSFFHCDNPRLKVLVRGCCGHATVFFDNVRGESCSRTDLECLRRVLPCSALLSFVLAQRSSAYLHFVWLWFCFSQYNTSTLTFTLLNCWYHWLTQSTSAASRPSSRVLTPASVKWRTGAWLWSWRAREPTLYAANLFLCSARIHHNFCHPLYLSQSTTGLLWTPLQERCDSRNIKKMLLMRLQTFVVATDGCFCGFFHGWFII